MKSEYSSKFICNEVDKILDKAEDDIRRFLQQHFDELVKDYESLGGNDYVHKVILPDMIKLKVISMDNLELVKALYESRNSNKCDDNN